jgi:hypothetical protein
MHWPNAQDYNQAVLSAATRFLDAELRASQAVADAQGVARPHSGSFADVYQMYCPETGKHWAVKCFTKAVPGLAERYAALSAYLEHVRMPFAVDFEYLEPGIRVHFSWFPVIKMRWVPGVRLNDYVRDAVDKPAALDALLDVWVRMARRLREAGVGHGDLQHGNVLVIPGPHLGALAVKLVDYDGTCVPSLADRKPAEHGHPNFQHPQRLRGFGYGPEMDRFSMLTVAAALRCLRVGGRALWARYDTGDNLLFRGADFAAPPRSAC